VYDCHMLKRRLVLTDYRIEALRTGRRLSIARRVAGITRERFAEWIGVKPGAIERWERAGLGVEQAVREVLRPFLEHPTGFVGLLPAERLWNPCKPIQDFEVANAWPGLDWRPSEMLDAMGRLRYTSPSQDLKTLGQRRHMQDPPDGATSPLGGAALATTRGGTRTLVMPKPPAPAATPAPSSKMLVVPVGPAQGAVHRRAMPQPPGGPAEGVYTAPSATGMPQPPGRLPTRPSGTQRISAELAACYPTHGVIADYMNWVHRLTHACPQFHLAAILPVIGYEANRRRYILENGEPLHVWSLVVAPSGSSKTTAMTYARKMHNDWGQVLRGQHWIDPWESAEGSLPGVASALMETHYDPASDSTNSVLFHSEMSKMMRGEDNLEWLCQLFDRGDFKRNLRYIQKAKEEGADVKDTIKNAKISACFTTTRASFQEVFREATMRGGFASRLLWFTGSLTAEQLMPMQLTDELGRGQVVRSFCEWTKRLDGMTFAAHSAGGEQYQADKVIALTDRARQVHTDYFDTDLRRLIVSSSEEWNSLANRASIYALRIAALYALVSGRAEIVEEDMSCAVALMRYLFRELEELLPNLRPEDRFQKMSRRVLETMHSYDTKGTGLIPRSAILRIVRLSVPEFDVIASTLKAADQIVEVEVPRSVGRPTAHYQIVKGK